LTHNSDIPRCQDGQGAEKTNADTQKQAVVSFGFRLLRGLLARVFRANAQLASIMPQIASGRVTAGCCFAPQASVVHQFEISEL
jgi:hypothetical protein